MAETFDNYDYWKDNKKDNSIPLWKKYGFSSKFDYYLQCKYYANFSLHFMMPHERKIFHFLVLLFILMSIYTTYLYMPAYISKFLR